ncbi:uncharacterized protein LOC122172662 isoform X2 [Chrysemys picta bellii]|uniref:uncharacterized protein LOC122172662 isoform X2 n=1 Tax=Chrysemys picta bellii TaxID=8478 RepID=UPI0032B1A90B
MVCKHLHGEKISEIRLLSNLADEGKTRSKLKDHNRCWCWGRVISLWGRGSSSSHTDEVLLGIQRCYFSSPSKGGGTGNSDMQGRMRRTVSICAMPATPVQQSAQGRECHHLVPCNQQEPDEYPEVTSYKTGPIKKITEHR